MNIPPDMIDAEKSARHGGAVVSIRDMMLLLGAPDEVLRDMDERDEILAREPWRKDGLGWVEVAKLPNGDALGYTTGSIDWSGTRFEKGDE